MNNQEIKDTLEKATPRPWKWDVKNIKKGGGDQYNLGELGHDIDDRNGLRILCIERNEHNHDVISTWNESDAKLIISAPTWLEEKMIEIERYQDAVESLYQIIQRGDLTSFDMKQADEVINWLGGSK
jgi:hypothetical protein